MKTRNTIIKLVHAGARAAFADEDARRAWQKARTGKASCADMTDAQLDALVAELRKKGALHDGPPRRVGRKPLNRSPYMDKIEALLADMGLSWQYAESIAWRVTGGKGLKPGTDPGVERLEWVRSSHHFRAIIAALSVEQEKRHLMTDINGHLRTLGLGLDYVDQLVIERMRGTRWQRDLGMLRSVSEILADTVAERLAEGGY